MLRAVKDAEDHHLVRAAYTDFIDDDVWQAADHPFARSARSTVTTCELKIAQRLGGIPDGGAHACSGGRIVSADISLDRQKLRPRPRTKTQR